MQLLLIVSKFFVNFTIRYEFKINREGYLVMKNFNLITLFLFLWVFVACQNSNQIKMDQESLNKLQEKELLIKDGKAFEPIVITVTNLEGQPLENAKILIGSKLNQPFENNFFSTDKEGHTILDSQWVQPASVTVGFPGYMKVTYFMVQPQSLNFKLQPLVNNPRIELSGFTNNFGSLKQDNKADFGLVMQAVSKSDLFSFNINKLISPEFDSLTFGSFSAPVPSNITFPRQRESYVIPIDLSKENYRLYFKDKGIKRLYALHGQFPFRETIDQFRKRDRSTNIINSFNIVSGTMREVEILGPTQLNIPVDEMKFDYKETVIPPTIPQNTNMITVSLFEKDGLLYPTDMKKAINGKPFTLKSINHSNRVFISLLANLEGNRPDGSYDEASSVEFVNQSPSHTPNFLNIISQPTPLGKDSNVWGWTAQNPEVKKDILPLATYSVFSKVIKDGKSKKVQREWEVYTSKWSNNVELPEWPEEGLDEEIVEARRWDVAYIGSVLPLPIPENAGLGPDVSSYMTHVSANSVEY